jgi:hypothetical protein
MKAAHAGEAVRTRMNFKSPNAATPSPRKPRSLSIDIEPMFMLDAEPVMERTPRTMSAIAPRPMRTPKMPPLPCHADAVPTQTSPCPTSSPSSPRSVQNFCHGRKLSIRSRTLPPAKSFSAVDIFDMSKPDELEPSIHCSFQPPRTRAAGWFSTRIQEALDAGVKHPAWDGLR